MTKHQLVILALALCGFLRSQEVQLPPDLRQLNLVEFNSSLLNPVFSLDRNNPESLALWTRWQWQTVDGDPTTIFLNYTRQLNAVSSVGAGFLQHNTGTFLLTGGALNYAYSFDIAPEMQLVLGLNLIGYQREMAADLFDPNAEILPGLEETNDFILQAAPGLQFKYKRFQLGFVGENLVDYNFRSSESETSSDQKVYVGLMSYRFPLTLFGTVDESYLQPTFYLKTLPGNLDNQVGFTTLFSTPKFWVQAGYNNFYGISAGLGGRFFKKWSIGALMEFGTSGELEGQDPTFEFVTAYSLGSRDERRKVVGFDKEAEEELAREADEQRQQQETDQAKVVAQTQRDSIAAAERRAEAQLAQRRKADSLAAAERAEEVKLAQQRKADSLATVQKEAAVAAEQLRQQRVFDSIATVRQKEALAAAEKQREEARRDSIALVRKREALAQARKDSVAAARQKALADADKIREQERQDSIVRAQKIAAAQEAERRKQEAVKPRAGEKYEEVASASGLEPGYYLIANVFGTKKYFDRFMKTLTDQGLEPKSFYRELNKYNYVYLRRYNSIQEARSARDSKFGGRYDGKTWIFRVVGE